MAFVLYQSKTTANCCMMSVLATWGFGPLCTVYHGQDPQDTASSHSGGGAQLGLTGDPPAGPQAVRLEAYEGGIGWLHYKCHAEMCGAEELMTPHQACWGAWG